MTNVTNEIFDTCHTLVEKAGFTRTKAAQLTGLGASTVARIIQCKTYDEYIEAARAGYKQLVKSKRNKGDVERISPQTVTVQASHYMMEELRQMNEHLRVISNKLAFIVDELIGEKGGDKDDGTGV